MTDDEKETSVIVSDRYIETERKLSEDPIIIEMAREVRYGLESGRVRIETFIHAGSETPRWGFMRRCMDEYRERGGTIDTHIGGPARAVLAVAQGKGI